MVVRSCNTHSSEDGLVGAVMPVGETAAGRIEVEEGVSGTGMEVARVEAGVIEEDDEG